MRQWSAATIGWRFCFSRLNSNVVNMHGTPGTVHPAASLSGKTSLGPSKQSRPARHGTTASFARLSRLARRRRRRARARPTGTGQLPYDPLLRGKVTFEIVAWDQPGAGDPMLATMTPQAAIAAGLPKPSQCDIVVVDLVVAHGHAAARRVPQAGRRQPTCPARSGSTSTRSERRQRCGKPAILVYRRTEQCLARSDDPEFEDKRAAVRSRSRRSSPRSATRTVRSSVGCNDYAIAGGFPQAARASTCARLSRPAAWTLGAPGRDARLPPQSRQNVACRCGKARRFRAARLHAG